MTYSTTATWRETASLVPALSGHQILSSTVVGTLGSWIPLRHVRPIREDDVAAVTGVLPAAPCRTHYDDLEWQRTGAVTDLIAWEGSTPLGSGFMHWNGPRDSAMAALVPGCPEIFRLEVLAQHRSKGVGAALIGALEALARGRGLDRVGLGVGTANCRARALYERVGYRPVQDSTYVDRSEYPDAQGRLCISEELCIFMVKDLGATTPAPMMLAA